MAEPGLAELYGYNTDPEPAPAPRPRRAQAHTAAPSMEYEPPPSLMVQGAPPAPAVSDAELAAASQQAQAQLAPPPPVDGPREVHAGAYGSTLAAWQAGEEALKGLGPVTRYRDNPRYPGQQRRDKEMLAREGEALPPSEMPPPEPFAPAEPFATPERIAGESDADYMARVQAMKTSYDADVALQRKEYEADVARQREEYEEWYQKEAGTPMARDMGKDGNIGELETERRTQERLGEAKLAAAETMATAEVDAAQMYRDAIAESRQAEIERRDFAEQQRDALVRLQDVEAEARKKLAEQPEWDGGKGIVQNMGLGLKILAVVSAAAAGFAGKGGQYQGGFVQRAIDQELRRVKQARQLGLENYEAAKGAVQQGMQLYNTIMSGLGDEAMADQMMLQMVGEDAAAFLRQKLAESTLPQEQAAIQLELQQIEVGLRERREQMKLKTALTPRRLAYKSDPNKEKRERLLEQQKARETQLDKLAMAGIDVAEAEAERGSKERMAETKARGQVQAKRAEKLAEGEMKIKEATRAWGTAERQIDDILGRTGEIHGRGIPWTGTSQERIELDSQLTALKQTITNAWTGATASPEQAEQFAKLVEGDWSELSDDALRARLRALKNIVSAQRRYLQEDLATSQNQVTSPTEAESFQPL